MPSEQQFWAVMECMEEYLTAQEQLGKALKDGLFNIARGKYTLGSSLGQQRYPGDMQAASTVHVCPPADHESLYDEFELYQHKPAQKQRSPAANGAEPDSSTAPRDNQQSPARSGAMEAQVEGHGHSHSCSSDPVTWFCALPPAPVRQAQSDFSTALQRVVAAANALQRLRQLAADLSIEKGQDGASDAA